MIDDMDILWNLYQDEREFARHHESQRTQGSSLVIAIAAGLVAMISLDQKISTSDLPSSVLLIALGVFGVIFTQKHYERTRLHLNRAYEYYRELNGRLASVDLEALRIRANYVTNARFGRLSKLKLSLLWMALHGVIILIGVMTSVFAALSKGP